jgi:hypothetical protein
MAAEEVFVTCENFNSVTNFKKGNYQCTDNVLLFTVHKVGTPLRKG